MTLYFFPTPYKGELLYSVFARYSVQSGNTSAIQNFDDLFATRNVVATMELHGKLNDLISNMPINSVYTMPEQFVYKHTLFPYLAAFVPEVRAKEVIEIMKDGNLSKAYNKLGITASNINQNLYFRFCPECVKEDVRRYGETYWHRLHQVTGVFVCPEHEIPICDSSIFIRGRNRQSYIPAQAKHLEVEEGKSYSKNTLRKLLLISRDIEAILNKKYTFQNIKNHKYIYMDKLIEKNIATLNKMIRQKKLRELLLDFWGEEVLNLLQNPVYIDKNCNWLEKIVRDSHYITNPLRNLLLARALDIDITYLLNNNLDLNKIKSHEQIWEERLIELSRKGLSLREMSKILDSTSATIKKHAKRLGIEPFWIWNGGGRYIDKPYVETEEFKIRLQEARDKWISLVKNNSGLSKNNLKKLDETLFGWLMRYDEKWINENSPSIRNDYEPLHWEERDEDLLPKVKEVVEQMHSGTPRRVHWGSIGRELGIGGWFSKNRERLPLVKAYIETVEESIEDFQVRKIKRALDDLEAEGTSVTKWNLLEKAGVKERYIKNIFDRVAKILEESGYDRELLL